MPTKKYPKRNRRPLRRVRIASSTALGALAALDIVAGNILNAAVDVYRVISIKAAFSIVDLGAAIDDGQEIGIAHGDYSAAEIEECLEAQGSVNVGDLIAREQADRRVRSLGYATGPAVASGSLQLDQGRIKSIRLNWLIGIGDTVKVWVRNGSGTVYTTGASVTVLGDAWVTP